MLKPPYVYNTLKYITHVFFKVRFICFTAPTTAAVLGIDLLITAACLNEDGLLLIRKYNA